MKKWLICSWLHWKDRCYPDVGGKGLKGGWHCSKCHPCGEGLFDSKLSIGNCNRVERGVEL